MTTSPSSRPILVLAGNGKVGSRIAQRLQAAAHAVRIGSRSAAVPFDWEHPATWPAALAGAQAVFISYVPDLAVPGAAEAITALCAAAKAAGVERLVLLSGRGEPEAQRCERIVQQSGLRHTVCRAGWFMQNLSEAFMHEMVLAGALTLPAGSMREPFIDCDDIAEVATAALLDDRHHGQIYELTGPELLSFADLARELTCVIERPITYQPITIDDFMTGLAEAQVPEAYQWLLRYLFTEVFDGRNSHLGNGVQRALGREPRSFATFAAETAATGAWNQDEAVPS